MAFTPAEKVGAVVFGLATVGAYAVVGWRLARPYGPTLRARLAALLSLREPSIVLDSARYVALVAWMRNTPDLELVPEHLRRGVAWTEPVGIFRWIDVLAVPPVAIPIMVWAYRALLALAICGVWGRAACAAAAVLHALLWSIAFSTVGYSVHNHVVAFILLSLALAPERFVPIGRYVTALRERRSLATVGTYAAYVRFAAAFCIATVYVQTGLEKILHGGFRWFNGVTLQGHSMRKGQLSTELASLPTSVFVALAIAVVAWETLYGFALFFPRWRPLAVLSGVSFHEIIRRGMGVRPFAFMQTSVLFIYTPYEAWTWIAARLRKKERADSAEHADSAEPSDRVEPADLAPVLPSASDSERARALRAPTVFLLCALLVAQWIPLGLRRGVYPFLRNAMFSSSLVPGDLIPAEARIVVRLDDGSERAISSSDAIAVHWATFVDAVFERYRPQFKGARDSYAGKERDFCEDVLRSIVRHAEPRATQLSLFLDYFVADQRGMATDLLQTCTLPPPP